MQNSGTAGRSAALAALTILMLAGSATMAAAKQPGYVGKWGLTAAQCKLPQDTLDAPMIIRARGYDQFETHCDFVSVKRVKGGWNIKEKCSVGGDQQASQLTLKLVGKRLSLQGSAGRATLLVRCK